jgi:hypothetical protein
MNKLPLRRIGGVLLFAAIAAPPLTLVVGLVSGLLRAYAQV